MKHKKILFIARDLRKNPTKAEAYFWEKVRKRKFLGYRFNRQYILSYSDKLNVTKHYIADFLCFEKKVVVEIDGLIHKKQIEEDKIREEDIENMGYRIIRFSNDEVLKNWNKVYVKLKEFMENY